MTSCKLCGRGAGPPARTADSPEDIEDSHHTLDLDPEARNSKRGLLYLAICAAALFALGTRHLARKKGN